MAISLSCLNVIIIIIKKDCVKMCSQDFGSLLKFSKGAFEALKLSQWGLQSGSPPSTCVGSLHCCCITEAYPPPPAPLAPAFLCYHFSVLCLFICQAAWRLPHHCAGTAGFIKHLTSSQYLMVNLNQGAAGLHSRNWPFPQLPFQLAQWLGLFSW